MALKCFAFGVSPSAFQDYSHMGHTTANVCLKKKFCNFPMMSRENARRLSNMHSYHHGVPGMAGSLDCMHAGRLAPMSCCTARPI